MSASVYEQVAPVLQTAIAEEFAAEGFTAIFDNLHESLGRRRVDIGIAPVDESNMTGNAVVQETVLEVRFYDIWKPEINPDTVVDPSQITRYAQRLREKLRTTRVQEPGTDMVWYFDIVRVQYPNDPTGNKTRFHATVRAYGNNAGLVETTA